MQNERSEQQVWPHTRLTAAADPEAGPCTGVVVAAAGAEMVGTGLERWVWNRQRLYHTEAQAHCSSGQHLLAVAASAACDGDATALEAVPGGSSSAVQGEGGRTLK